MVEELSRSVFLKILYFFLFVKGMNLLSQPSYVRCYQYIIPILEMTLTSTSLFGCCSVTSAPSHQAIYKEGTTLEKPQKPILIL